MPVERLPRRRTATTATPGRCYLSPGRSIGLRLVPMARDLRFAWEEMPQQMLDEQAQKVRESLHAALIGWAQQAGEGSDYTDNLPLQCLHPVGHWYEVPNLLRNGVLARAAGASGRSCKYLMVHNIDTLGADVDPALLGLHIEQRRVPDHRGDRAADRGPRRRAGARRRPRCGWSKGWRCRARRSSSRCPTTTRAPPGSTSTSCWRAFGLTRGDLADEAKVAGGRARAWPRACRPTSRSRM